MPDSNILLKVQKPARYTGGEINSIMKDPSKVSVRFGFCFPDTYEIGMSHLGMKILYSLINEREDSWCERVFAPAADMEEEMRKNNIALFGLESGDSVRNFDFLGFSLQYELSYTNVLNMIDLAGMPIRSSERDESCPVVIAGGPCTYNPEPVAAFIDIFQMGEGEEMMNELIDLYVECKNNGLSKHDYIEKAASIEGVYVPSLYSVSYNDDGTIREFVPRDGAPKTVKKRIIKDMDSAYYPEKIVVPFIDIVHDRISEEIFRGCIRGCRFCQAGFVYRPVREKSPNVAEKQAKALIESTGYDEVSLLSLSTSDYTGIQPLLSKMIEWTEKDKINISLPSLRIDNFPDELAKKMKLIRKSSLTFAPEAGSQRLRDVINKNITEDNIMHTVNLAYDEGWNRVKLYFMMGLPTETEEDIKAISELCGDVVEAYYKNPNRQKGKSVTVSAGVSTFVPKPFTPFQWEKQDDEETVNRKQKILISSLNSGKVHVSYSDYSESSLEAVFARGDRKLCRVIETAFRKGCTFDSWSEHYKPEIWKEAFDECNIDPMFYSERQRSFDEILPWDFIDIGVTKAFLIKENEKAHRNETTPNCREKCSGCGCTVFNGGVCYEKHKTEV